MRLGAVGNIHSWGERKCKYSFVSILNDLFQCFFHIVFIFTLNQKTIGKGVIFFGGCICLLFQIFYAVGGLVPRALQFSFSPRMSMQSAISKKVSACHCTLYDFPSKIEV